MDNVDRRLTVANKLFHRLVDGGVDVVKVQRHGPGGARHQGGLAARALSEVILQPLRIAQGGAHQKELRLGEFQQRNLPSPAAIRLGIVVELVHHYLVDLRLRAIAQGNVGNDFGGGADDRCPAIHCGVTSHHPDILRAEGLAKVEELLAHQGLDRRGVKAALLACHGDKVRGDGDHGLARAGGGGQNDVVLGDQRGGRLLLGGVEANAAVARPAEEGFQKCVVD